MKRKLKKFALIALAVIAAIFAVWRLHLAYGVSQQLKAVSAAGLPASGEELNLWWTEVADAENAAGPLQEAFDLKQEFPRERAEEWRGFRLPPRNQPLPEHQRQFLADYVALNTNALARADEALRLPKCRYPMDFSWGATTPLPHLSEVSGFASLCEYAGVLARESNQPSAAAVSIMRILGLARTLEDEPTVISQLTRARFLTTAVRLAEGDLLTELDEAQLSDLQARFSAADKTGLVARALIGERATLLPYFRMSLAEAQRAGKSEDGDGSSIKPEDGPPLKGRRPLLMVVSGFFERDMRFYLQTMETSIALTTLEPPRSLAADEVFEKAGKHARKRLYLLSSMTLSSFSRIAARDAGCTARLRTAIAALAVERFRRANGRLPEKLGELAPQFLPTVPLDPFDGQPLRYRRLPKGYVIYSVDRDLSDNEGRERLTYQSADTTAYDITFTVEPGNVKKDAEAAVTPPP